MATDGPEDLRRLGFFPLPEVSLDTLPWVHALLAEAGLLPEDHAREGPSPSGEGRCVWAVAWLAADLYGTLQPPEWGNVVRWRWLHAPPQNDLLRALTDLFVLGGPSGVRSYWVATLETRFAKVG